MLADPDVDFPDSIFRDSPHAVRFALTDNGYGLAGSDVSTFHEGR